MFDFNTLFEFSRTNCIAICAFLVPANLLLTLQTMIFTGLRRPQVQVRQAALLACIPALVMMLHVYTWFMVGVVMAPTYILLWLGITCMGINLWAITHSQSMVGLLTALFLMLPFELSASLRK
jgi:asparagine N-glycosylation enzyme membrane subunit Stt3